MFDPKIRILVVDDMLVMRKQVSRLFHELGFQNVLEAEDGVIALQLLQNEKPQVGLVVSDYEMPNANGLDLFKRIHSDTRFRQIPFILMALEAEQASLNEAIKAGVPCFIHKPFKVEELKQKLEELHKKLGR